MDRIRQEIRRRISAGWAPVAAHGLSWLAGLLVAVVLHYVLYRIGLPSQPFIYVAF